MSRKLTTISVGAAAAVFIALTAVAETVDAKDWQRSIEKHYDAADAAKYSPRTDNPEWGFTLDTVMADMAWRERTVRILRDAPRPSADPTEAPSNQLADRPETRAFRFSF